LGRLVYLPCEYKEYGMSYYCSPVARRVNRASARRLSDAHAAAQPRPGKQRADLGRLAGHHLGYLIRRAQIWIFQDFIRTLAEVDIRPAQYSVLLVIEANVGLSQSALAQTLGIERARLVHLLDSLGARNLVQRARSKSDRRSHTLMLTGQGRSALARIKALADEHEQRLAQKVGVPNHKKLLRLLAAFARG
jgi:DNA-binding MarR family transcriptional regulator